MEDSLEIYLESLVAAFAQVWRVLKDDGTLWLNIGDVYTSGGRTWRAPDKKNPGRAMDVRPPTPAGLKPKDLIGVPWGLAFKLQESGWYLRSDVIWNRPNCQPESVKDRPTKSHEYVFLFSKMCITIMIRRPCGDLTTETFDRCGISIPNLFCLIILLPFRRH